MKRILLFFVALILSIFSSIAQKKMIHDAKYQVHEAENGKNRYLTTGRSMIGSKK